jgi:glucosamine--fructose-6-phosphate aminotransferase (isomerizing)
MCGIVGFCGHELAAPILVEALKQVEYRGYDSAGIATLNGKRMSIRKAVGKLEQIENKYSLSKLPGKTGIGHTRWATHGTVTKSNAHPHTACKSNISVVHNGTIDNYQKLRRELISAGHKFKSQTDTEVIPHLIEVEIGKGHKLEQAVLSTARKLEGSNTFLTLSTTEPEKIVGFRKDTPLVVGICDNGNYVGSDILIFPENTIELFTVDNEQLIVLKNNKVKFFDNKGKEIYKYPKRINIQINNAQKGDYAHFMLKEIMEQSQAIESAITQDKEFFIQIALDILRANQVIITACGTSRYAALVGRYLFSKVGKKFCDVIMSSEFQYFADSVDKNALVIGVSQSGETADVLEGVKRAKAAGANIISIINRPVSLLSELSNHVIYLNCGPEISVAATKSFTSQIVIFYLLAFAMTNGFDYAISSVKKIKKDIDNTIKWNNKKIMTLCKKLKNKRDFYFIARGINFAIASEGALKLKEISYIHAEGMPAGELKHGTLALIEKGTPVVVVCPDDYTRSETLNNAIEAKTRGAFIIAISDEYNEIYDFWIKIPKVAEFLYPLVTVVPLQLLAYYMAVALGYDPDKPRNLAKSVTVK